MKQKRRDTFTIDYKVSADFKSVCDKSGLIYSNVIEILMVQFTKEMQELAPLFKGGLENVKIGDLLSYIDRVKNIVKVEKPEKK